MINKMGKRGAYAIGERGGWTHFGMLFNEEALRRGKN